jgi:hypothetical protein
MFLLVCVLSLQTGWAAVHFCDESAALAHAAQAQDDVAAAAAQDDAAPDAGALHDDHCCAAAHGAHVLQSLMSQEPHAIALGAARAAPAESPLPRARQHSPERVERPQWSAA